MLILILSLKISAVEPQKEISIKKNTKYKFQMPICHHHWEQAVTGSREGDTAE